MRKLISTVVTTLTLAATTVRAEPFDQIVGVNAANGGALLVKRVPVPAGATIIGAEVVTNDIRTAFPKVTLYRGHVTRLSDATVIHEFQNVRGSDHHHIALSCSPIQVAAAEDFYVAVTWPASDGLRGPRDGAAIPAVVRSEGGESFIASGLDKELQLIEGLELGVRLILGAAKGDAGNGETTPVTRAWRTFLNIDGSGGGQLSFRFGVERSETVSLAIHDVGGRRVRILLRESFEPGEYVRTWDGRNDAGIKVASGIYIARFVAGERTLSQKVVVTR